MPTRRPWIHAAEQTRSHATADRILATFARELARRPLDAIRITDIASRARVSVGGLYARFRDKTALLHELHAQLIERLLDDARDRLAPARHAGRDLASVLRAYVELVFGMFTRHRVLLRQVAIHSRAGDDAWFLQRVQEFNQQAHGLLHELALARRAEIRHGDPPAAIDFGLMFISAALREQVLFGDRRLNKSRTRGRALVDEITRAWLAYLVWSPDATVPVPQPVPAPRRRTAGATTHPAGGGRAAGRSAGDGAGRRRRRRA